MFMWVFGLGGFFDICFYFPGGKAVSYGNSILSILKTAKLFPRVAILHSSLSRFPNFSTSLPTLVIILFITAIPVGMKLYCAGVLICISLMTKGLIS